MRGPAVVCDPSRGQHNPASLALDRDGARYRQPALPVTAVDTTQEALDKLRASESPDHPAYVGVVADMDNLRLSARALHRSVMRMPADAMPRLIWMHGESEIADELRDHLAPRLTRS